MTNTSEPYPIFNKDFREFAELLNANAVEYLIVGGYAMMAHGHPRYTGDIDFWIKQETDNIRRLLLALDAFGFRSVGLALEDFEKPDAVIQLGFPPARIDLMVSIEGVAFDEAYQSRLDVTIDGLPLHIIGLAEFIRNKTALNRPKDIGDIMALVGSKRAHV